MTQCPSPSLVQVFSSRLCLCVLSVTPLYQWRTSRSFQYHITLLKPDSSFSFIQNLCPITDSSSYFVLPFCVFFKASGNVQFPLFFNLATVCPGSFHKSSWWNQKVTCPMIHIFQIMQIQGCTAKFITKQQTANTLASRTLPALVSHSLLSFCVLQLSSAAGLSFLVQGIISLN